MYQVLYRKYRPKVFSDVVGQDHITSTLSREVESGKHAHAYLFTGSRGTGKTTCAKILSKAVNCLSPVEGNPCGECDICRGIDDGSILDIVEIDAASNNGVDNIRDIRDEINFTPAACKYRVYIIDEVHMLSIAAFNALLKTLEEPPAHVKFILATTEVHKLPVTVISRCQRFDFKRVSPEAMIGRMKYIAAAEGFTATDEALSLISRISDGGMRDALSLLDQCSGESREITADIVYSTAGMTGKDHLFAICDAVAEKDSARALEFISDLYANSYDMERLCVDLTAHFRNLMVVKTVRNASEILVCTAQELEEYKAQSNKFSLQNVLYCISLLQNARGNIKYGANRRIEMEMTVIKLSTPALSSDNEALLRRIAELERAVRNGNFAAAAPSAPIQEKPEEIPQTEEAPASVAEAVPTQEDTVTETESEEEAIEWAEVLSELMKINMPLWGILNGSTATVRGDHVIISSDNPTLPSFIRIQGHSRDVKLAIYNVTGKKYRLGLASATASAPKADTPKRDPLENLVNRARNAGINVEVTD